MNLQQSNQSAEYSLDQIISECIEDRKIACQQFLEACDDRLAELQAEEWPWRRCYHDPNSGVDHDEALAHLDAIQEESTDLQIQKKRYLNGAS